ncbi:MAG: hypothetical protein K0U47_10670 [Epsilonproteobacteria bacterium]|nr:hypothetical protein [Campylobacterota bacterium]
MSTITLARIYEKQGHMNDALAIYKNLLEHDPQNSSVKKAIRRIRRSGNTKVTYFTQMHTKEQFENFEKWLVKPWS